MAMYFNKRIFDELGIEYPYQLVKDGDWTLKFYIPDSFLIEKVGKIAPVCKGNFYKCGEDTDHSHFITWCEVEVDKPDFHIPDFFGFIEL